LLGLLFVGAIFVAVLDPVAHGARPRIAAEKSNRLVQP